MTRDRYGDPDRDRFDRDSARSDEREPSRVGRVTATAPVITSARGPKYVASTHCPHCFFPKVGITFHGELASGQKVYELAKHSEGAASVRPGKPLCRNSHARLERLEDGTWSLK